MFPLYDENPTRTVPWVTYGLIAANVLAFLWQISLGPVGERAILSYGFVPAVLFGQVELPPELYRLPPYATIITSLFLHGGIAHLAGNMLYLWIFGNNVEEALGRVRYILFYLACGVAAALFQGVVEWQSTIPMIGASGAISGVLGAYGLLYPRARVLVLIPLGFILYPARLSAYWVLGAWFALQAVSAAFSHANQPGVAWWAHFGGFIVGCVLVIFVRRRGVPLFAPELPAGRR